MTTKRSPESKVTPNTTTNTTPDTIYSYTTTFPDIGVITLYSDGDNLIGLSMPSQQYRLEPTEKEITDKELPIFKTTEKWLTKYFAGKEPKKFPPIRFIGTPFRQKVWQALLEIPHGQLVTYGDLAKKLYPNDANTGIRARAIGGAVGHNPIPIIVPCHRVVGANNNLTGYTGGLDVKIKLHTLEGVDMEPLKWPKRTTKNTF